MRAGRRQYFIRSIRRGQKAGLIVCAHHRTEMKREVGRDVEIEQFGIHIGIQHRQEVDAEGNDDTQIPVATVVLRAALETSFELLAIDIIGRIGSVGEEVVPGRLRRIAAHEVGIGFAILGVRLVVPQDGISASGECAPYDRQLPVLAIVDLTRPRQEGRIEECTGGIGFPRLGCPEVSGGCGRGRRGKRLHSERIGELRGRGIGRTRRRPPDTVGDDALCRCLRKTKAEEQNDNSPTTSGHDGYGVRISGYARAGP